MRWPPRSPALRCRRPLDQRRETPAPATALGNFASWGSGCRRRPPSRGPASCRTRDTPSASRTRARCRPARSTTGPSTSGMTSPALRMTTVSPISTPLRLTSEALCSVAWLTVDPATLTGSMKANGRDPAGAADVDLDVEQLGGGLLGRILVRDRPPRRARRGAQPALQRDVVDLRPPGRRFRARRRGGAHPSTRRDRRPRRCP